MAAIRLSLHSCCLALLCCVLPYARCNDCCDISCIKHVTFERCDSSDPNLECPKQEHGTCSCYWNPSAEKCYANTYSKVGVSGSVIAIIVAVLFCLMVSCICCYYRKRMNDEDKDEDEGESEEGEYHDGPHQGGPARGSQVLQRAKKKVGFFRRASLMFAEDVQQTARTAHRRASDIFTALHTNNPAKPEVNTVSIVSMEDAGGRPLAGGRRGSFGSMLSGSGVTRQSDELRPIDGDDTLSPHRPFTPGMMGGSQRVKKVDDIFNVLHDEEDDERNSSMQVSGESFKMKRSSSVRSARTARE
eukprot:CAMPEP_0177730126 /NCGR_PEP_ID=MMETSP0484_2-20121128/21814_1 /TAXON_ID=354590 /ORGANISM="Rhodomonas lens, Strain RHODO" /LENGTH=301 /DNA_ID=CAMNT_0019243077 /DNA_START=175 /DNA_END=1077 /DNA_ORIENTATION=+